MNDSNIFRFWKKVGNFLFRVVNKEFLIFLFFLLLSSTFWLLITLNDTYEQEIVIPVHLVDVPKNVVLTSDTTMNVRVTVRDKGYTLLTYKYSKELRPVVLKFKNYAQKTGYGVVTPNELQKLTYQRLFNSSRIVSMKPDKVEFFFNYGLKKRMPVKLVGKITPDISYYVAKVMLKPDSVDVYASREVLDSMKYVTTQPLYIKNLSDTVYREVILTPIRGVKYVPNKTRVAAYPDILTEEKIEVPITAINMPEGKVLRTFPSRVTITFTVGASLFRNIKTNAFKVVADYNELVANPSEKCNIYLRYIPHDVKNARININQVDYLIEEQ